MASPSVSILTPIWRPQAEYFRQTVASVLAQTHADFEYVIVEDPSEFSAAATLTEFDDARIRHLANPQRTGLCAQRNHAVAEARGEWLVWIDGDDLCEPDRVARQLAFVGDHPDVDVLGSAMTIIDGEAAILGRRRYPLSHEEIVRALPLRNPIGNPSVMTRRAALLEAGGFREGTDPCEDYDLWCRMARSGRRFANLPEALTRYRMQPNQLKRQRLRDSLSRTLQIKRTYFPGDRSPASRLRRLAEASMLYLPPSLVMKLFLMTQIERRTN